MARRLRRYRRWMGFEVTPEVYFRFMGRFSEPLAARFAAALDLPAGARALDVGCGPGALTAQLVARLGVDAVTAVDPSESFVAAARARFPGLRVIAGVAESLPAPRRLRRPDDCPARRPLPARPRRRADGDGPRDPAGRRGRGERLGPRRATADRSTRSGARRTTSTRPHPARPPCRGRGRGTSPSCSRAAGLPGRRVLERGGRRAVRVRRRVVGHVHPRRRARRAPTSRRSGTPSGTRCGRAARSCCRRRRSRSPPWRGARGAASRH